MAESEPIKTFRGSWDEVVTHRDEIPAGAIVEVRVYELNPVPGEGRGDFGGKTLGELYGHLLGVANLGPDDLGERAEEYLAESGFGETREHVNHTPSVPPGLPKPVAGEAQDTCLLDG